MPHDELHLCSENKEKESLYKSGNKKILKTRCDDQGIIQLAREGIYGRIHRWIQ